MPQFSLKQMRAEYEDVLFTYRWVMFLILCSVTVLTWLIYIPHRDQTYQPFLLLISMAVPLAAAAMLLGVYLVISDRAWLMRHTPYGKALSAYGNARERMDQIDAEAFYADKHPNVMLLQSWLILFCPERKKNSLGSRSCCACPIPVKAIDHILFSKDAEGGMWMTVWATSLKLRRVYIWDQEEGAAVMQWLRTQEIKTIWTN
ncbi:MAG: hypothetical protein IJ189_11220 [Clostridia bacterium]|nr:hypothetical protein [Clostridia bacterium]